LGIWTKNKVEFTSNEKQKTVKEEEETICREKGGFQRRRGSKVSWGGLSSIQRGRHLLLRQNAAKGGGSDKEEWGGLTSSKARRIKATKI